MRNLFLLLLCLPVYVSGQQPSRHIYAVKGADTLWMDHYKPKAASNGISILFVHGGGFTGGDPANQTPFAEGMTRLGYNVFVIKYRLYLKGKSFGCETVVPEKMKAIRLAVEDTEDATQYLVTHAATLNVDTSRLFLSGSSAGAETVLNLVYNPFRKTGSTFRYAGVLSFAGAVLDINRVFSRPSIPLLLMHGTKDQLVPYGTAAHHFCNATDAGWVIMFGSNTLYEEMQKRNMPVVLYTYEGKGHEVANYMFRQFKEIDDFIKSVAAGNRLQMTHIIVKE